MASLSARLLDYQLWIPGVAMPLLVSITPPFLSPDGVEAVSAGACALSPGMDCAGLELWFWPPAFGLLGGVLVNLGLDPGVAATWLSLLCGALALIPLSRLAQRLGGPLAAWTAPLLLLSVPDLRLHLMMGDARPMALLGLLWAWELALARKLPVLVGLMAGLSVLARTEMLLPVAALMAWLGWYERRTLLRVAPALALSLLPYWIALSLAAGRPTISSQGWQSQVYPWLQSLPMTWLELDLAAGARGTPFRVLLSGSQAGPGGGSVGLDLGVLSLSIQRTTTVMVLALAALGIRQRGATVALLALGLPALAVTALLPQAQDLLLPAKNLLPFGWVLAALAASGLSRIAHLSREWVALAVAAILLLLSLPRAVDVAAPDDSIFSEAVLADLEPGSAGVALSTAPLVLRAGWERHRIPSPWAARAWLEGPERADYLVLSTLDQPFVSRSLAELQAHATLEPVLIHQGALDTLVVVRIVDDSR